MKLLFATLLVAGGALAVSVSTATAATINYACPGGPCYPIGVSNLVVGGLTYDIEFKQGYYADVFPGNVLFSNSVEIATALTEVLADAGARELSYNSSIATEFSIPFKVIGLDLGITIGTNPIGTWTLVSGLGSQVTPGYYAVPTLVAPVPVTSVSVPANGTYTASDNLDFTVNFSENVTVNTGGGTPRLTLTIGSATRYASYVSGAGTSAHVYRYTVQAGDFDTDGIGLGSSIDLNGGTLKDAAGNDAATTLNSVGSLTSVLVDAVAPAAPSTPNMTAGTDTGASTTDNITSNTTPTFTGTAEANSTVTVISSVDGTLGTTTTNGSGNWLFTPGSALTAGTHNIIARATDGSGNVSSASTALAITIDVSAPAAPSTPDLASASDTGGSNTDNVTGDTTPTFTGTAEANSTVTVISSVDGTLGTTTADGSGNWSLTPSSALAAGAHDITATATDGAGNVSSASSALAITIDASAPAVTSVTVPANGTYISGQNLNFTVNFTESVTVNTSGGTPRLTLTIGSATQYASYVSGSDTSALIFRYTVQAGDLDTDGISLASVLDLNKGTILDGVGNDAGTTLNSVGSLTAVLVDAAAPLVSSVSVPSNGTYTLGQNLDFTVNFSENVTVNTGGGTPRLTLTIGSATRYASYVSGSGTSALVYRYTVQPGDLDTDGIGLGGTVDLNGGTIKDAAGNDAGTTLNSVGSLTAVLVQTDVTAPEVSLSGPSGLVTEVFEVTATFTEDVNGFEVGDFSVGNGTVVPNSFTAVSASTYKIKVQPTLGETVTVDIPAGVATDAANNLNTAAEQYSVDADSPGRYFNEVRDQIRTIITGITRQGLSQSIRANQRFMTETRSQMISAFLGSGLTRGDGELPGGIPFDVTGTINLDGDLTQIHAASAGAFVGQTGFEEGVNWRVTGTFNLSWDSDGNLYTMVDGKVAREQMITRNLMLGGFVGGSYSNSDIKGDFAGTSEGREVSGGAYFFASLGDGLFADGFGSVGYSFNDINLADDVLSLSGDHNTLTWQVGGSLTGVYRLNRMQLRPNISLSYGNSDVGLINFKAAAYGITEDVSLDAGNVALGTLRITPEILFPIPFANTYSETDWLSFAPSFICEHVVADRSSTDCGWGAGIGVTSALGFGSINTKLDWQYVGDVHSLTGQLNYSHSF